VRGEAGRGRGEERVYRVCVPSMCVIAAAAGAEEKPDKGKGNASTRPGDRACQLNFVTACINDNYTVAQYLPGVQAGSLGMLLRASICRQLRRYLILARRRGKIQNIFTRGGSPSTLPRPRRRSRYLVVIGTHLLSAQLAIIIESAVMKCILIVLSRGNPRARARLRCVYSSLFFFRYETP